VSHQLRFTHHVSRMTNHGGWRLSHHVDAEESEVP
jgi:hypothetical protein